MSNSSSLPGVGALTSPVGGEASAYRSLAANTPSDADPFFSEQSLELLTQHVLQDLGHAGVTDAAAHPERTTVPSPAPAQSLPQAISPSLGPVGGAAVGALPSTGSLAQNPLQYQAGGGLQSAGIPRDEQELACLAQQVLAELSQTGSLDAAIAAASSAARQFPGLSAPSFTPSLSPVSGSPPIHDEVGSIPTRHLPPSPSLAPSSPPQPGAAPTGFYFIDDLVESTLAGVPTGLSLPNLHDPVSHVPSLVGARTNSGIGFDINQVRRDFPILGETVNGRPLIWFDNAATTQKPQAVIDRLAYYYSHENSNIHRAAHELAARSTDAYENAREQVRRFLNAPSVDEIVFVRGTTEGINLIAKSWGAQNLKEGDEILITWLEHHANIVPWQQLCAETGARLRVAPVDDQGQVLLEEYQRLLSDRTKLVSFTQVSNALGTITPAREMIALAHRYGARVLLDGAQSVSHLAVDVQSLDCDWFVFSGHKIFGPTGIGVVYGKQELLNATQPWQGGGNMIVDVTFEKTVYHAAPARFEAGTGNIADAVGLGAALDYVQKIGLEAIDRYEHELLAYGTALLSEIPGLRLIGTAPHKAAVLSFVMEGLDPLAIGKALNREGIAVRAGHHCAQPILRRFGVEATVRPSLAFYNTFSEIDTLASVLHRIQAGSIPL